MPLPFGLDHINLWSIEDDNGWAIVDTGVSNKETKLVWKNIFGTLLNGLPINKVIVTHMHADQIGMAGWPTKKDLAAISILQLWNICLPAA